LGEEGPDRWVPAISVGGAVTGSRSGSRAEMGRGAVAAGRRGGKRPAKLFLFLIPFPFKFSSGVKINWIEILRDLGKM
jgi:hypothetical protein